MSACGWWCGSLQDLTACWVVTPRTGLELSACHVSALGTPLLYHSLCISLALESLCFWSFHPPSHGWQLFPGYWLPVGLVATVTSNGAAGQA